MGGIFKELFQGWKLAQTSNCEKPAPIVVVVYLESLSDDPSNSLAILVGEMISECDLHAGRFASLYQAAGPEADNECFT